MNELIPVILTEDPFYRYKMEKVKVLIQKNKTVITNLNKISEILKVNPVVLHKFISKNLNTHSIYKNEKWILNGIFNADNIQKIIYEFTEQFIKCKSCGVPEIINGVCCACGIFV
jgi:translation initiation factor 2 beta subunit (eIF-2beta)/eIF-5